MTVKKFNEHRFYFHDSWLHPLTAAYQRHGFSHMLWVTCLCWCFLSLLGHYAVQCSHLITPRIKTFVLLLVMLLSCKMT